jgi:LemA protein
MKASTRNLLIILGVVVLIVFWAIGRYNNMVAKEEGVKTAWSNVETQYQRRSDLIPNLVNVVKGYASHEKEVLQGVVEARAKATSMNIDASKLDAETMKEFQAAQSQVSSSLSRLLLVVENYPDLKANQNFLELQSQLEGTENRIAVERKRFNETVNDFNTYIRTFPNNMIAGFGGFTQKERFASEEGSEKAPEVKF